MRVKIRLDTVTQCTKFSQIAGKHSDANIFIVDGNGLRVNGKSVIGAIYSMEFSDLWCESDKDISGDIIEFII